MKTIMYSVLIVLVFSIAAKSVQAQVAVRPAWDYSLDERLELRAVKRARAAANKGSSTQAIAPLQIDGRVEPELFLPHDLFEKLVSYSFSSSSDFSASFRRTIQVAPDGTLSDQQWNSIGNATSVFRDLKDEIRLSQPTPPYLSERYCRERYKAMRAVALLLGGEDVLLRILYAQIAPHLASAYAPHSGSTAEIRRQAGGCQRIDLSV